MGGNVARYLDFAEAIQAKGYEFITTKEGLLNTKAKNICRYSSGRMMNQASDVPTLA